MLTLSSNELNNPIKKEKYCQAELKYIAMYLYNRFI